MNIITELRELRDTVITHEYPIKFHDRETFLRKVVLIADRMDALEERLEVAVKQGELIEKDDPFAIDYVMPFAKQILAMLRGGK